MTLDDAQKVINNTEIWDKTFEIIMLILKLLECCCDKAKPNA